MTAADDTRFELAAQAASHERRNRPRLLVFLAAGALLITAITALTGLAGRSRAAGRYQDALDAQARVNAMLQQVAALNNSEAAAGSGAAHDPYPIIYTKIEDAALRAGLARPSPPTEPDPQRTGGVIIRQYAYTNVRHDSIGPLLEWLRLAVADVPGLELFQIVSLKPDAAGWNMSVTFRRWERTG